MICHICKKPVYVSKPESWGVKVDENKKEHPFHFDCKFGKDEEDD